MVATASSISGTIRTTWSRSHPGAVVPVAAAQAAIAASVPLFLAAMVLIVIALFNDLRQPAAIWATVPLAIIGITAGLLSMNVAFGFMGLLGSLSLVGLLIKNAIVLLEEIDMQIASGKESYTAILDSAVSRMRPVMMAASTTILGMAPLLSDVFFLDMAVVIMFGLGFASVLTLIVVPVLYAIFFNIKQNTNIFSFIQIVFIIKTAIKLFCRLVEKTIRPQQSKVGFNFDTISRSCDYHAAL